MRRTAPTKASRSITGQATQPTPCKQELAASSLDYIPPASEEYCRSPKQHRLGQHDGHTTVTEKSDERVDAKTLRKARHPNAGGPNPGGNDQAQVARKARQTS